MTKLRLRDSLMDILSWIFDFGGKNTRKNDMLRAIFRAVKHETSIAPHKTVRPQYGVDGHLVDPPEASYHDGLQRCGSATKR